MMSYIEPAPIKDKDNPLESMMQRFDKAITSSEYQKKCIISSKCPVSK